MITIIVSSSIWSCKLDWKLLFFWIREFLYIFSKRNQVIISHFAIFVTLSLMTAKGGLEVSLPKKKISNYKNQIIIVYMVVNIFWLISMTEPYISRAMIFTGFETNYILWVFRASLHNG